MKITYTSPTYRAGAPQLRVGKGGQDGRSDERALPLGDLKIGRLIASMWLVDEPFSPCQRYRPLEDEGEEVGALVVVDAGVGHDNS